MKASRIILGLFLVAIGVGLLLQSLGIIDFEWGSIWRLWPLIFIIWGLSAITNSSGGFWVGVIGLIVIAAIILFSLMNNGWHSMGWSGSVTHQELGLNYSTEVKEGKLIVNDGAGKYTIAKSTERLAELIADTGTGSYELNETGSGVARTVEVERNNVNWNFGRSRNDLEIKLNPNVVWDMEWNIGASQADLDLSQFKMRDVLIKSGATDMNLKFGVLSDSVNVNVKSGASDIEIATPSSVGVKIENRSGLTGTSFRNFVKKDSAWYSPDYDNSTKKINISLETGVSNVKVTQY